MDHRLELALGELATLTVDQAMSPEITSRKMEEVVLKHNLNDDEIRELNRGMVALVEIKSRIFVDNLKREASPGQRILLEAAFGVHSAVMMTARVFI